jgi:dTDP-4-dehydrorhamnose 3,5-epimerase
MKFVETKIQGAFVVEVEPHRDERGFFARSFCQREFAEHGLSDVVAQCNVSYNEKAGTLRGMHFQLPPSAEAKLVRTTAGAIFDAIVDVRPQSPSYLAVVGVELRADLRNALYVPEGCAHGFQTLVDDTEVFYQMSEFYAPQLARGFRYDDPRMAIPWPLEPTVISANDLALAPFDPEAARG